MQRLLIALPILLLVAGLVFGGGFYMYSADNTPAPTVAAGELSLDEPAPLDNACAPLDDPIVEPEPEPEPEDKIPTEETPKPVEKTETPEDTTNAWRTEIESKLAESGLSEDEMAAVKAKLELAIQMAEEQQKRAIKLSGTVKDYASAPVANANVYASYTDSGNNGNDRSRRNALRSMRVGTTDETGAWNGTFIPPPDADTVNISIYATSADYLNGEPLSMSVTAGETYDEIALAVKQGAGITGRVVDQDFTPIAGARVMAFLGGVESKHSRKRRGPAKYATTDENGNFTLAGLNDGIYRVTASATGFRGGSDMPEITVASGAPTPLGTDVVLNRVTAVKVKLVCAEREPRGYASATFYDANGKTRRSGGRIDEDGYLLLANAPDNAIEFEVNVSGYEASGRIPVSVYAGAHSDAGEVALVWTGLETTKRPTLRGDGDVKSRAKDLERALEELEKLKELKALEDVESK